MFPHFRNYRSFQSSENENKTPMIRVCEGTFQNTYEFINVLWEGFLPKTV